MSHLAGAVLVSFTRSHARAIHSSHGRASGVRPIMMAAWLYVAGFGFAFLLSVIITRWLRPRAASLGLMDVPRDERHSHERPIATVGGLAIFVAIAVTLVLLAALDHFTGVLPERGAAVHAIVLGSGAMLLVGLWDDVAELSPGAKAALQVLIAAAAFAGGIRLLSVELPFFGLVEFTLWPSLLLTILWLVGITNAFNLVDGADGLAGGAALLATLAMLATSLVMGHYFTALLLVITAAAVLGFLHFNFPPATVFMGDAGSLFLGFLLASLGLASSVKAATVVAIFVPVVALGLPVLDTVLVVVRRLLRGERVSKADRGHIHHRLVDLGHSPREVVLILYGVCGLFGLSSLILISEDGRLIGLGFLVVGAVLWFGIQRLRIPELMELRRAIDRGIQQRQVIAQNVAIRERTERIARSGELRSVFAELAEALERSAFEQAEIWLSDEFLGPTAAEETFPELAITPGGYLWYWRNVPLSEIDPTLCWEVKLPFLVGRGEQVGRITLRRRMDDRMPTDVQVIADLLLPEVSRAVDRLRVGVPGRVDAL